MAKLPEKCRRHGSCTLVGGSLATTMSGSTSFRMNGIGYAVPPSRCKRQQSSRVSCIVVTSVMSIERFFDRQIAGYLVKQHWFPGAASFCFCQFTKARGSVEGIFSTALPRCGEAFTPSARLPSLPRMLTKTAQQPASVGFTAARRRREAPGGRVIRVNCVMLSRLFLLDDRRAKSRTEVIHGDGIYHAWVVAVASRIKVGSAGAGRRPTAFPG